MKSTILTMIMAGGKGERLYPLTRDRAKPAVPFGGIYRIIDFALSNCVNSGFRRICVLTQYKSLSLIRHLNLGWNIFNRGLREFLGIIPAQQRIGEVWYRGTADSIYQNLYKIDDERPSHVLILAGDHVYKMDYSKMLDFHILNKADLTLGVFKFDRQKAKEFGVVILNDRRRIKSLIEKPQDLSSFTQPEVYVSMGIYIFKSEILKNVLVADSCNENSGHDFARDIIPKMLTRYKVYGYVYNENESNNYWRDIGTLDAYYEANMELVKPRTKINLQDKKWPIRTYQEQFPPVRVLRVKDQGYIRDSIVSHGCIIRGGIVEKSVLSYGVNVGPGAKVLNSVLMEGVKVGKNALVKNAILDKDVNVPQGSRITPEMRDKRERFYFTSHIVVVPKRERL